MTLQSQKMYKMLNNSTEPKNKEFFDLFARTVEMGLDIIRTLERQNTFIGSHYGYTSVRLDINVLPGFTNSGLRNYGEPFGLSDNSTVNCKYNPVFTEFIDFVKGQETIRKHFEIPSNLRSQSQDDDSFIFDNLILRLISTTVDRYLHKYRDGDFSLERLKPWYREIERGIFDETLYVDILVPILMLTFDFDSIWLKDDIAIFKMNNEAQEARAYSQDLDPKVHWVVANATSHAFMFKGFELKNKGYWRMEEQIINLLKVNDELINTSLALLKTATNFSTGYAQILINPVMWAFKFMAHLPSFIRKSTRAYPMFFDEGQWLKPIPIVKKKQVEVLKTLYANHQTLSNKRIKLALKRLNTCLLRDNEEDRILDVAIGLEALFADDEKQEITHKLALRAGAISKLDSEIAYKPKEVFTAIKKVYSYRSAVAHGSKDSEKKRVFEINGNEIIAIEFAIELLRKSIMILLENQKYLEPSKIDEDLLLNLQLSNEANT